MAIIAKFTRTLPAPSATISGGFVFLLSAGWFTQANTGAAGSPIDGGANSLANGGGDMQIFSDTGTTTRLPIEVVSFVTGGSPVAQVWVRTPSYTAGDTITIGKDDTQTVQPAVGAAFGRNDTWVDYDFVTHDGGLTDSALGLSMVDDGSGAVTSSNIGDALTAPKQRLADLTVADRTSGFTLQVWHSGNSNGTLLCRRDGGSYQYHLGILGGNYFLDTTGNSSATAIAAPSAGWQKATASIATATNIDFYSNGSLSSNINRGSISTVSTPLRVGYRGNGGLGTVGYAFPDLEGEVRARVGTITASLEGSEYTNQNDPDNFGTSSEYILVAGGGISVTATLGTIDYNSSDAVVGLTGSIDVIATLGTINYSSNDAVVQISGETNVITTLGTIEYSSSDTVISLFGNVDVVATLGTISYDSNDVSIGLTGGVNVNATLGAIDYTSNDTVITLQGQVSVTATLGAISYDSNNVTVQVGTGQFIGTVTAGFADDLYSAGFKPSEITVSFKS